MAARIRKPARNRPPSSLGRDVAEKLISACGRRAPTGKRNAGLIALLSGSWLRVGEALALEVSDVDLEACTVRVANGKGNVARTVGLAPWAVPWIERWIATRAELLGRKRAPLFVTLDGRPLWDSYVRALLTRLGKKAGIQERVHAHGLRHGAARTGLRAGLDIGQVRDQLGHVSIATTSRYLSRSSPAELAAALARVEDDAKR